MEGYTEKGRWKGNIYKAAITRDTDIRSSLQNALNSRKYNREMQGNHDNQRNCTETREM